MKASAPQLQRALAAPPPDLRLFLLHGPDEAGAAALAAQLGQALGPGAERVDLDGATLRTNPGRLADEAASMSLFGDRRWIRVTPAGEECVEAAALLLGAEHVGNPVVMIAPTLKTTARLVKLATAADGAMAFASYLPEGANAERMVADAARAVGLRLAGGAGRRLFEATGGDRAVLAREVEKLALYLDADPERVAELDDAALDAVGADLADAELGDAIAAAVGGDTAALARQLAELGEGGVAGVPLARQLARRLVTLADLRGEVDGGASIDSVVGRPQIFFRDRPATARALRRWSAADLERAVAVVREAERRLMDGSGVGQVAADAAMVTIARMAARRG